jgi:TolB-like protein
MSEPPASAAGPWLRIKEHKVLQWSLAYLGAALALAHAQELVGHAFHWPEVTSRIVIGALIVGFPLAVVTAWYHGHKGLTRISAGELTVVSVMLLVGAGVLILLVRTPSEEHSTGLASGTGASIPAPAMAVVTQPVPPPSIAPAAARKKPRLAVLPFENLSPDPENAFFTDGLHEEILATLAQRAPGLEVISRTTMMMYRQRPKPLGEVARELGATHVIEGSVRRAGKQVRLTLQLIDAGTDDHLWAQNYDRTLSNALTLQSDVANEVASQLSVQLARRTEEFKPPTRDPEAYDLYLKALLGRDVIRGTGSAASTLSNIEDLLDRAIARDPSFAVAYAQRAVLRMLQFMYNIDTHEERLQRGREDLATAVRLAPGDPNVLNARAQYLAFVDDDMQGALAEFEAAGLTDPLWLYLKAEALFALGRFDEAIQHAQRTVALDPKNAYVVGGVAGWFMAMRKPVEALRYVDFGASTLRDDPQFPEMRSTVVLMFTGRSTGSDIELGHPDPQLYRYDDTGVILRAQLIVMRADHRWAEMTRLLDATSARVVRGFVPSGGEQPVAELRGWTDLCRGDRTGAARAGREVLDFVAQQRENRWNRLYLRLLAAEGHLFAGDHARAIALAPAASNSGDNLYRTREIAAVLPALYAWAGAEDEAVSMLERLSTALPMTVPPVGIARDPLYALPLAKNPRYRQLAARIEAEMAATKLQ